jgi:predicted DNA-binding antitoxin AbrB/MazE fold protein
MRFVEARYEEGLLRPTAPLALRPGETVNLLVVRRPDPRRWDLARLADPSGAEDDRILAEQGLTEWAERLDEEDDR